MKPKVNPPRLLEDAELGELMRSAAARRWSPERLAHNGLAIHGKIAGLSAASGAAGATAGALKATAVTKIVLPVAVLGVVSTAVLWESGEPTPAPLAEAHEVEPVPAPEHVVSASVETPAQPAPPATPASSTARPRLSAERARQSQPSEREGGLADQLRLFEAARAAAATGEHGQAVRQLDELGRRYPESPLRGEILVSRAEYLRAAGRDDEALPFIESILDEPAVASKKGQLLRVIADIWLRKGDCGRAVPGYQRALGLGLPADEADAARDGLRKCRRR